MKRRGFMPFQLDHMTSIHVFKNDKLNYQIGLEWYMYISEMWTCLCECDACADVRVWERDRESAKVYYMSINSALTLSFSHHSRALQCILCETHLNIVQQYVRCAAFSIYGWEILQWPLSFTHCITSNTCVNSTIVFRHMPDIMYRPYTAYFY